VAGKTRLGVALQSIRVSRSLPVRRRPAASSPGIRLSFRVLTARSVSPYWLNEPASPLALASALRDSAHERRAPLQATASPVLSSTSAFLQSLAPTVTSPDSPPKQRAETPLLGFGSLQHRPAKRVHDSRAEPPPALFRLQGLATLLTAYAPRRLVGSLSSRQRSWDFPLRSLRLPGGGTEFPRSPHPPAVSTANFSDAANRIGRHRDHRLPGFGPPPESHDLRRVFSPTQAGCSLGVFPFQGVLPTAWPMARAKELPLHASPKPRRRRGTDRRLRVSISGRLT